MYSAIYVINKCAHLWTLLLSAFILRFFLPYFSVALAWQMKMLVP